MELDAKGLEAATDAIWGVGFRLGRNNARSAAKLAIRAYLAATGEAVARNDVLEEAAKLCDDEADLRFKQARLAQGGDISWGLDTHASSMAQDHKAITARGLAEAVRALKVIPATPEEKS
jgi:hypothetical protein